MAKKRAVPAAESAPEVAADVSGSRLLPERVPIERVQADPFNPRVHPAENLDAIEASLIRFGQVEALAVQAGTYRLIAGHGRLSVMRDRLGWSEVEVVPLNVTDGEAAALSIALNRTGELAKWDEEKLASLLRQVRDDDEAGSTGFTPQQVEELLSRVSPAATAPVEPEPQPEPEPTPAPSGPPVVTVQLTFSEQQVAQFERLANGLMAKLGATDYASCVLAAMQQCADREAGWNPGS